MAIDTSALMFPKHAPRRVEVAAKESEHDKKLAKAYRAVEEREDNRCQVTGVELKPFDRNDKRRREHHHLKGRNVKPEWVYRPERIILVSKFIHDLLTANALLPDGCDARKPIKFRWNRNIVKHGKELIRLRPEVTAP